MEFNEKEIAWVADLSKLELSESEISELTPQLEKILGYVGELQGIDISNVDPVGQITGLENRLAKDEVCDCKISREELLNNAPAQENGYVKVKSVFDRD
ncbi:MAG: Asp-tRNA(Asn)/Glu-tRNA(Gln) amidotransferase subunit GatC [Patescibacteria group bacterium]|nr:Asp-tRNA(Asn)/Glu-tRNA(Gln) amidotransferase subunit GatC [Patescibacteria group bacterium]